MSTTHGQPGLSSDQRSTIRSTILSTRHTLEDELRRQLKKYGIYEAKKLPLDKLTHLSVEEIHTRRTLDAAIERELESTDGDLERSITNYVREATKTYLNRFVALKTIEVRGLVEETITERPEYGNRSYMHHTVAEIAGELTNASDDGFGAALDLAYQEIGAEIRMIFEDSEHTAIDLDPQAREEILDELDAINDSAWKSDEVLGWVYQYFGEQEREDINTRVDEENYKVAGTDIATKTQLFTPRYIVEWMVDNSLGRTWLEMRGDRTAIDDPEHCYYLAPMNESLADREEKSVAEITVLDPACGSGHMLFYAFDVLYQMYLEEGKVPEKYIPRNILQNNLYGVDIDSGSAQIAALSLYLKAKEKSPEVSIPQINILSADAVLINGDKKKEVLERAQSELERNILEQIWTDFDNIREWGSLVQIEEKIEELIDEEKQAIESKGQSKFTTEGGLVTQSSFATEAGRESWEQVKERLINDIRELAGHALDQNDPIEEMFAGEVEKSVELLDVFLRDYDVVIANPPYLQSKKMGENLKEYVRAHYKGKYDVYGAFIERGLQFARDDGYVSMVTPEKFMSLYYFRGLRKKLLNQSYFVDAAHLRRYSFDQQKDRYTIAFVLKPRAPSEHEMSRFARLNHERDEYATFEKKQTGLRSITQSLRDTGSHQDVYEVSQQRFNDIGRRPFLYWFGEDTLRMFSEYSSFDDIADVVVGLQTDDDERFVRKWWEVPKSEIDNRYIRFQMSGSDAIYYDYAEDYVDWGESGEVIENEGGNARNKELYLKRGATFRGFGTRLIGRLHKENMIFSHTSHYIHSEDYSSELIIAHLNSTIHRFIANGLNPGLHYEVGDAKRLPIKEEFEQAKKLEKLVETGIENRKKITKLSETSADFDPDLAYKLLADGVQSLLSAEDKHKAHVLTAHGISDSILCEEYEIPDDVQNQMYSNLPKNVSNKPTLQEYHVKYPDLFEDEVSVVSRERSELDEIIDDLRDPEDADLRELALETDVSPLTIAYLREQHNLYTEDEKERAAGRAISFLIGALFGRWETSEQLPKVGEEILAFEPNNQDLDTLLEESLETIFKEPYEETEELREILGDDITEWIRSRFFRYHHVGEYKRRGQRNPIYWQLESPDGAFSCFVYYHDIDENTLPKLRGQYLDPRIDELENELETLNTQTSGDDPDKELLNRKEKVQNDLDDIKQFHDTIDEMIDDGVTVDVEKGIWENIKEWDQYEVLETGLPKLKSSYSR